MTGVIGLSRGWGRPARRCPREGAVQPRAHESPVRDAAP